MEVVSTCCVARSAVLYLLVEYRDLSLAQYVTVGRLSALLCPCEHCNERNGEERERKGARRVFCAAPSLHRVQDGALIHCHNIVLHARGRLKGNSYVSRPRLIRCAGVTTRRMKREGSQTRGGVRRDRNIIEGKRV